MKRQEDSVRKHQWMERTTMIEWMTLEIPRCWIEQTPRATQPLEAHRWKIPPYSPFTLYPQVPSS